MMESRLGRTAGRFPEFGALVAWLESAPAGTTLAAEYVLAALRALPETPLSPVTAPAAPQTATWRERLWTAPAEARLGVPEAAEAVGRPVSWVYRHTSEKAAGGERLPHRKLDGELMFTAGELRMWIREHEEVLVSTRPRLAIDSTAS